MIGLLNAARQRRSTVLTRLRRRCGESPEFLGALDGLDYYRRGPALFAIPTLPEDGPPAIIAAIQRRREACLTGRCECGASLDFEEVRRGQASIIAVPHAPNCFASTDALRRLVEAYGWRP